MSFQEFKEKWIAKNGFAASNFETQIRKDYVDALEKRIQRLECVMNKLLEYGSFEESIIEGFIIEVLEEGLKND